MVWANLGTAALLTGLVAAMATRPAAPLGQNKHVEGVPAPATQSATSAPVDDSESFGGLTAYPLFGEKSTEPDREFLCAYPAQLTFGFHVPNRIDAGLRWCFNCGAWQPCACPRSVAGPPVPFPVDEDPQTQQTVLDRMWEASRSLGRKLEELNAAMDDIQVRARTEIDATDPDLYLKQRLERARRQGRFPDPGPMIKSAFGILIPDSINWPTLERYFAKPIPGSRLPDQRPATTQATP